MRQIVLDLGGADNGAWVLVQGASMALQAEADLSFLLVGQGEAVQQALQSGLLDANRVELLPAERQIAPATHLTQFCMRLAILQWRWHWMPCARGRRR